ncbi:hypothetical protein [Metabacillus sp. cB07]|uniref:hypothetical protein n=1 Tax=Metabacillus sp. cB07 TaxID=2806989 RepID=UPI00193A02DA|nr:hypothetical protein [Metabacillus sp. cB07]
MLNNEFFRLDRNLKRSQLPDSFYKNLGPYPTFQMKTTISVFTLFMIDFLLLFPMLALGVNIFTYLTVPLIAILNIWALALLFRNVEKTQVESIQFIMFLGLTGSWGFFLLSLKFAYMSGVITWVYYAVMTVLYITSIFIFFYKQLNSYWKEFKEDRKDTPRWHYVVLSAGPPIGYILAQFLMGLGEDVTLIVMTGILIMFSVFFTYLMTKSIHKYLFVKNNPHLVNLPEK